MASPSHKTAILITTTLLAAAIFGLFLTKILLFFSSTGYWPAFLIMILFAVLLAAPPLIALRKKCFDPFEPIYLWIVIYTFLYLAKPFVQILKNEPFRYGGEFINEALGLAIIGLLFFYLGYYSFFTRKIAARLPVIKKPISSRKLTVVAWAFIIIGFLGLNNYIQTSGGWQKFWSKPHGLAGQALKTTAYIYQLPELMVIGFLLIYEIFIHRIIMEKKLVKLRNIATLIMASIGGVGIYTIIWGSRTLYSWIIIAMVVLYFLKKGTRPKLKTAILAVILLFLILNFVPFYRSNLYIGSDFSKTFKNRSMFDILGGAFNSTDEFNSYLAEVALVPNSVPYDNFNLYGRFLLHPIPRLIWPDKPTFLNSKWDDFLAKSGIGWGSAETMLGDFYAQAGIWALILGTFLSGVFWRTIYEYLRHNSQNRSAIILYAVILPNMFTYLSQSALIALLKWLPYMVPSTLIALLLSREKKSALPR